LLVLRRLHEPLDPAIVRGVKRRTVHDARRKGREGEEDAETLGRGEGAVISHPLSVIQTPELRFQKTFQGAHRQG
jgi:hypothetical protein